MSAIARTAVAWPTAARVAAGSAGVGVGCLAAASWLDVAAAPHAHGALELTWTWVSVLVTALLGARIVQRHPRHPVGWILTGMALVGGTTTLAEVWAFAGLVRQPGSLPAATLADVLSSASWLSGFAGLAFLLLYFPDGRVPGRRWRAAPYALGVAFTGAWLGATVQPGAQQDPMQAVNNPVGIEWFGGTGEFVVAPFMFASAGGLILCAASVIVRYRGADSVERRQFVWLAYAVVLLPIALIGCLIGLVLTGTDVVGEVLLPLALVLVPTTIGLAVLRYRLYDVDYFINRTLVYALVTAVLFGVFVATALGGGIVIGHRSPWSIATATLLATLLAGPVRRSAQRMVDRRFDRAAAQGIAAIDAFHAALQDEHATPAGVETTLAEALTDSQLRVWLWLPDRNEFVDVSGHACETPRPMPGRAITVVEKGGEPLAAIDRSAELDESPRLLRAVLHRARLGLELARLAAESAHQVDELQQSRARIVEATYEERRRLERDLHDGVQQRLVALGVGIRRLQRSLPPEAAVLAPALDRTVDEIGDAITDLRRLSGGLRPARLDDGLAAALADLARSAPLPIDVVCTAPRAPLTIETSAYFVACEAVTNAVKHANATRITIEATQSADLLRIRVLDDGVGGALVRPGAGLTGLADRIAAIGGQLAVTSPTGRGTTVEAVLPCAS